jgi:hypothetical protein
VGQRGPVRTPDPLPAVLTTSQARQRGALPLLRDGTYRRVGHGVHLVAGADVSDPDVRIAVAVATVPGCAVVGGWAAARLHEQEAARSRMPQLDGAGQRGGPPDPVLLLVPPGTRLVSTAYRRVLRSVVGQDERTCSAGTPVTTPLRTAFDIARLSDVEPAVVALDRLRALGLVRGDDLSALVLARPRARGSVRARRAVALSADGVESPQESVLRLVWLRAGLPRPLCNPTVVDERGAFVARVDLLDEHAGLVGEYDGAVHASAARRSADAARQERLEALGLVVVRASSRDVMTPGSRAAWTDRLLRAHRRALSRPPGPRRWSLR